MVVQTGESIEQSKVFKAHAVPQGLCTNEINALNKQEDEDCFFQNIVKDLGKESREGLTDGLRKFIKVDNERALDVGALRRGSDVIVRENPDELTLRAE